MIIDTLLFYFFIAAIWWLYSFSFRDYMVDKTRQILFEIRDELFDSAMDGCISFDDKAYILTRDTLNGLIRFTHNFSLIRFIILSQVWKYCDTSNKEVFGKKFDSALSELTEEQKKIYLMALMRSHLTVTLHLMNTSIFLTLVFWPLRFIVNVLHKVKQMKDHYTDNFLNQEIFDNKKEFWRALDARANFIAHQ